MIYQNLLWLKIPDTIHRVPTKSFNLLIIGSYLQSIVRNSTIAALLLMEEQIVNRGVAILAFLLAITIGGGILTANVGFTIPILQQSTDPAASPFMATNGQAMGLVLLIGFVLVNVIGAGLTMAGIFWLLNWQVNVAKETPTLEELREQEETEALPGAKLKQAS